jgi:hypothetical protein
MSAAFSIYTIRAAIPQQAAYQAIDDDGSALNTNSADGRLFVRVRVPEGLGGGFGVLITPANACSRGTAHVISQPITAGETRDIHIPRVRFTGTVNISTDAAGVTAYAFCVPSTFY